MNILNKTFYILKWIIIKRFNIDNLKSDITEKLIIIS